ncbi:hypothetical protein RIR_jg16085.t1 [Rhizophagus irregularis DAOM 181602=DAOM 197198]|uniref:Uncharacterized protein n=1 Tax=Rhizophagus irregularis (strain DAOM 181602 / DAOM 197198 / MUCL 43194) TaxID=747089 RepID=U9SHS0_RHIID|nr:hypothetical protein RIR_jg16085.t1 [Rhizophagus irregularis DAOM 181602=DAOM 197198]
MSLTCSIPSGYRDPSRKQSYVQKKRQRGFYEDGKSIFIPAPGPHPSTRDIGWPNHCQSTLPYWSLNCSISSDST